jgi:hypothetical protein
MDNKPSIISEGSMGTNLMRGRDVRDKLMSRNIDPVAREIIAQLAEINHTNMKAIAELATMQTQMVDIIQGFSDVAQNMKDRSEQMLRATNQMKEAADGNPDA